jgi:ketosteroid isomerase-like protein
MASANVELVRSICAPWERGDFSSTDWADQEIEYVIVDGPSPGRWTGLAGLAEGWRSFLDAFEDFRAEAEEYREIDADRVLVPLRNTGRGKASGVEVGQLQRPLLGPGARGANLFHLRDGKVTRLVTYMDRERAFADLGLAPETGSPGT